MALTLPCSDYLDKHRQLSYDEAKELLKQVDIVANNALIFILTLCVVNGSVGAG